QQRNYLAGIPHDEVRAVFKKYQDATEEYHALTETKVFKPLLAGNRDAAVEGANEISPIFLTVMMELDKTTALKEQLARSMFEQSQAVYSSSRTWLVLLVLAGVVVGQGFGLGIARLIARPVDAMMRVLETVATGDLTKQVKLDTHDEVGRMANGL